MGAFITMMGFAGNIAAGMMHAEADGDGDGDREKVATVRKVFQQLMTSLAKLGPVVAKIDFYSSESSVSTFDGKSLIHTEWVVRYKDPAAEETKTAGAR